ncbi:hypothetical protein GP486_005231 [Trichoglossum hirsutum]|uniref:Kelch repeat protein n=1 Tax=Trichoglossum hirsutum TaxID=265104 RepID=A0A9P8L9N1_9PEZI|nr:hypothetical protein GP486_005231 [Trichoglossum hirsutum]
MSLWCHMKMDEARPVSFESMRKPSTEDRDHPIEAITRKESPRQRSSYKAIRVGAREHLWEGKDAEAPDVLNYNNINTVTHIQSNTIALAGDAPPVSISTRTVDGTTSRLRPDIASSPSPHVRRQREERSISEIGLESTDNSMSPKLVRLRDGEPQLPNRRCSPKKARTNPEEEPVWRESTSKENGAKFSSDSDSCEGTGLVGVTEDNNFLILPLTSNFDIASPTLHGLPQPSGPPPVANGYLWRSQNSLFLYGGLFSDKPATSPVPFSMWEFDMRTSSWNEHKNPKTSTGNNSDPGGQPVQRAAEGAGVSVPELGRGWYFGGHLDGYTTEGWSQSTPRVYVKSLLEFTYPGFQNDGVRELAGGRGVAPDDGVWRNITQGGLQESAGFPERADGVLVYVPGWAKQGILIGMAGGTNATFTQMNIVDIYDIENSTWYKQATNGPAPNIRVNPCAVVASAPDGSSFQVYLYGGQNLIPYGSQIQYDDLWILTVPSFTWINVSLSGQSNPPGRAGHTCDVWDSQMVVVGGYVGQDLSCDSPGIYVFDLSELTWKTSFTSLDGSNDKGVPGLSGSYGYRVPEAVQSVIGGDSRGGATITEPALSATAGPFQTGRAPTFTVTQSGTAVTATAVGHPASSDGNRDSRPSRGTVIATILAGVCFIAATYFGFCTWIYRRQLTLYRNHIAAAQRTSYGNSGKAVTARSSGGASSSERRGYGFRRSSNGEYTPTTQQQGGDPYQQAVDALRTMDSSTDDLMRGQEPSFLGVLLSPRRSLRVINRD